MHRERIRGIIDISDFFFCNEREADMLFGSPEAGAIAPGAALFITRGERGARVVLGDLAVDVPAVATEELDPTGAGDTFCGYLAAALHEGLADKEALTLAAAAGSLACTKPGAIPVPGSA